MLTPRKREGMTLPESSDPPIEMTSLGEPSCLTPDPCAVPESPTESYLESSSAGLYPEITAAPYNNAGPLGPPPGYSSYTGPVPTYVSPAAGVKPVYVADTPEELGIHQTPSPMRSARQSRYRSDAPWHTEQSTTIVVNQPQLQQAPAQRMAVRPMAVEMVHSPDPVPTQCYNCEQNVVTYIYYESGSCSWMACLVILMAGGACGCCLIPFFINTFKDNIHKCPKCHVIIGKHRKMTC